MLGRNVPQPDERGKRKGCSDNALNASKNVALPMTRRAFLCQRENGTCSIRERANLAASAAPLCGFADPASRSSAPTRAAVDTATLSAALAVKPDLESERSGNGRTNAASV